MNPSNPNFDPKTRVGNNLRVLQPGEKELFTIKRHPIGLIGIYIAVAFVLIVAAVFAVGVLPGVIGDNDQATTVSILIFALLAGLAMIYALIATKVYWGNSWDITSDSLTQVNQVSLFGRQSSQLSLENLEDVTAEQNGILPHIFNYGILKAETAGEHSKFKFLYCPNPNFYAQQILNARETFLQGHPELPEQPGSDINTESQPITNPEPPASSGFKSNS